MPRVPACMVLLAGLVLLLASASGVQALEIPHDSDEEDTEIETELPTLVPEAEQMFDWIRQHGGQVNVALGTLPGTGKKVFATKAFNKGETLFEVPVDLIYRFLASGDEEAGGYPFWGSAAAKLWAELHNPASPFQPYFQLLPKRNAVWSMNDIPDTYLPLVQNEAMEAAISLLQRERVAHCTSSRKSGGSTTDAGPSEEEARYTLSLLETRVYGAEKGYHGIQLMPLVDFADHSNASPHHYHNVPCSSNPEGSADDASAKVCLLAYAGAPIQPWEEILMKYRYLLQDMSLIQYGFLQEGPVTQQLSRIDRHDFQPTNPWNDQPSHGDQDAPWSEFEVTDDIGRTMVEISRLEQLLSNLTAADGVLSSSITPHPRDADGWFLQQLWVWRGQRQEAIKLELDRLQEAVQQMTKDEL